jgi:arylsulfatase A-like enzyme
MVGRLTDVPLYVRVPGVTAHHNAAPVTLTDLTPTILHYLDAPVPGTFAGTSLLLPEAQLAQRPWPASTSHGVGTSDFDHVLEAPMLTRADLVRRQAEIARWARLPPELAVTSTSHRYLLDMKTGSERLYDRARDPLERHDLVPDAPDLVQRFRARAAEWRRDEAHRLECMLGAKN